MFLILLTSLVFAKSPLSPVGQAALSNCTGFLFKTQNTNELSKARVMTNGHCVANLFGMILKPDQVIQNKKAKRKITLFTNSGKKFSTKSTALLYATMTGTDIAIYELSQTYKELSDKNIYPLEVSLESARAGDLVSVVSKRKKQKFECFIEAITDTKEGGYQFKNALRLSSECKQGNGTSGSPIMSDGLVVGIANSFNKNGKRCSDHNPCEINDNTISVHHKARYGQQVTDTINFLEQNSK
jgi:hypothetical protein